MTAHPRTVSEHTPIESALSLMRSGAFRRLPVVNEDGKLVGIVTLDDVLGLLAEELALIGGLLERQAPHAGAHGAD
jgi:Mg/Co/Ni transporter MgtE